MRSSVQGMTKMFQNCHFIHYLHAARGLASIELSFHTCNILRDNRRDVPRANKKMKPGVRKTFCNCGSNNWETVVVDTHTYSFIKS